MSRTGRRLSPQRLAKLANALGVSTPIPSFRKDPSPSGRDSPSITANTSSRFLLHVIPPAHLPHPDDAATPTPNTPGYHKHFLRGTLVPVHPTLQAQLAAIAREYGLPSTAGLILYLINNTESDSDEPGPRLSDEIWRLLWSRVVFAERSPSPLASPRYPSPLPSLRPLACSPTPDHPPFPPSTPSSVHSNSAFKSDTLLSDPDTPDTSVDLPPSSTSALHKYPLDLPGLSSPSLIPILAKVEFDIDKRKASWYDPWVNSRLKKKSRRGLNSDNSPLELLTVKRSDMKKNDPLGLSPLPNEEDEDATATYAQLNANADLTNSRNEHKTHNHTPSTEEEVLDMLDMMSNSKSRSTSSISSISSLKARKVVLPSLVINTNPDPYTNAIVTEDEDSYLAYTQSEDDEFMAVKREFAVFDDMSLDLDPSFDDPNDRRRSQIIMRAKLDEIERTMAQLSPRILHSDLSFSPSFSPSLSIVEEGSSLGVSPRTGQEFLSPRSVSKEFLSSSPPRSGSNGWAGNEDSSGKSWPTVPFSTVKEKEHPLDPPPTPRLEVNGRPQLSPPANGVATTTITESEKRRRQLEEEQGVYDVTVGRDLASAGPLSPNPFGRRYPSSPDPQDEREGSIESRARSGTMTMPNKSRFSADSASSVEPAAASSKTVTAPTNNRTTLMSVKTIKKLWRKSKDKDKEKIGAHDVAPPPTPSLASFPNASAASSSSNANDIGKSLPAPPRPGRPSEEQLDLPDTSMQAAMPPRLPPGLMPRNAKNNSNDNYGSGRRTPQELAQTGRRTPQEQLMHPPPSRPSLDQLPPSPHGSQHPINAPPNHPGQIPMFQGRNPHNRPVTPVLAMHFPSRSVSASSSHQQHQQPDKLDVNRLMFDHESPYPVRLASGKMGSDVSNTRVSMVTPPPAPSVEAEKSTTTTTTTTSMRKSILKAKLSSLSGIVNGNNHGVSDSSSSTSSSSSVVPRQSLDRPERSGSGSTGPGRGGRRLNVVNFGSTSSQRAGDAPPSGSDSNSTSSSQVTQQQQAQFRVPTPQIRDQNPNPNPSLSIPNSNPKEPSRPPSRQSLNSPSQSIDRRSDASSFDMTQFEFVSPVPAATPAQGQ